jgi:U2-associated protein SR140
MPFPVLPQEGDTLKNWRIDPFQMIEGGQAWLPPPMLALDAAAATKKGERERGLSELERDKFEDMLRGLTAEREAVCDVSHGVHLHSVVDGSS